MRQVFGRMADRRHRIVRAALLLLATALVVVGGCIPGGG